MQDEGHSPRHLLVFRWLWPFAFLLVFVQVLVQVVSRLAGRPFDLGAYSSIQFILNTNASALASTLGILMALVLFVVYLSSMRYSFNIIGVFAHNPVNATLFCLYILSISYNLWLASVLDDGYVPRVGTFLAMIMTVLCFGLLVPYFGYLFGLLSPTRLLDILQRDVFRAVEAALRKKDFSAARRLAATKVQVVGDVCRTALSLSDADVARHSIWILYFTLCRYIEVKPQLPKQWFATEDRFFRGRHELILQEIEETGTWLERRILEQMQDAFNSSLTRMELETVNITVSLCARLAGERALELGDDAVQELLITFFNTFLRQALNSRDARAGYHLLYQYDLYADAAFEQRPERSLEIAQRICYYGRTALGMGVLWMAVAAAHDLRTMIEAALRRKLTEDISRRIMLNLMSLIEAVEQGKSPAGGLIIKAALAVGAFLLFNDKADLARELALAVVGHDGTDLANLAEELRSVVEPRFWEVTDRVVNFDYLEPGPRGRLSSFLDLVATEASMLSDGRGRSPALGQSGAR